MSAQPSGAIIIAAYNEESVIARCLLALAPILSTGELQVVVACNGCTDRTASIARTYDGVTVLELATASKTAALRAGDAIAVAGPRIYLDADVVMTATTARAVIAALKTRGILAARPPLEFDSSHSTWAVRRWYGVRTQVPSIGTVLWGAGSYALSAEGRARFGDFPEIVSDDLFIDSLFSANERAILATDPVVVRAPRTTSHLLRILRRTYRSQGDVGLASSGMSTGQRAQLRDLLALVGRKPGEFIDAVVYVALILTARSQVKFARAPAPAWERDSSSREGTVA